MCVKFFKVVELDCSGLHAVTYKMQNLSVKYMLSVQGSVCYLRRLSCLHVGILAKNSHQITSVLLVWSFSSNLNNSGSL